MDEVFYLLGSISATLLLLGHAGWLLARWHKRVQARRPDPELTSQLVGHLRQFSEQLETMSSEVESQLEDVQERLDFAERIIAKGRGNPSEDERN
jgi:hypothetical protein